MADSKHTPGPWMAAASPSSIVGWPVVGAGGRSICSVSWLPQLPDEVVVEIRANASLIAAAPEMLEALRPFARARANSGSALSVADFNRAVAAIAKAEAS